MLVGRLATIGLFVCSSALVYLLDTAKDAFDLILQIGAGTGLLYLARWFWWRVNAWCEVVAMTSPFVVSLGILALSRTGTPVSSHTALVDGARHDRLPTLTAFLGPETDRRVLVEFYRTVRPFGPGWAHIRQDAGLSDHGRRCADNIPMALAGWVAGCTTIWSALFTIGYVLYGRAGAATALGVVFAVSGLALVAIVRRLRAAPSDTSPA
ncbi:MAG: hypothetical protein U0Q12_03015 [Vicinamibacterales bacterium]